MENLEFFSPPKSSKAKPSTQVAPNSTSTSFRIKKANQIQRKTNSNEIGNIFSSPSTKVDNIALQHPQFNQAQHQQDQKQKMELTQQSFSSPKEIDEAEFLNKFQSQLGENIKQKRSPTQSKFGPLKADDLAKSQQFSQTQTQFNKKQNLQSKSEDTNLIMKNLQSEISLLHKQIKEKDALIYDQKVRISSFRVVEEQLLKLKNRNIMNNSSLLSEKEDLTEKQQKQLRQQKLILEEQFQIQLNLKQDQILSLQEEITEKNSEIEKLKKVNADLTSQIKTFEICNLTSDSPEEEIIDYIQHYNPEIEVIPSQIEFVKQLAETTNNPIPPEEIKQLKEKNEEIIKKVLSSSNNNIDDNKEMQILMILQKMLLEQGVQTFITDEQDQKQRSKRQMMQYDLILTGNFNSAQYYSLQLKDVKYKHMTSKQVLDQLPTLKEYIAEQYGIPHENAQKNIVVLKVQNDASPSIDFKIQGSVEKGLNSKSNQSIPKPQNLSIEIKSLLEYTNLSQDMFDPKFDQEWEYFSLDSDTRGALMIDNIEQPQTYYFPKGYKGYGINVLDKYKEEKTEWLSMGHTIKTWIVLFHGTKAQYFEKIMLKGLQQGWNNVYTNDTCRITKTQIQDGCYLSDKVEIAGGYATQPIELNQKKYKIVFQCRVNPKGVKSPLSKPDYYIVEKPFSDIRPYRILLKEI